MARYTWRDRHWYICMATLSCTSVGETRTAAVPLLNHERATRTERIYPSVSLPLPFFRSQHAILSDRDGCQNRANDRGQETQVSRIHTCSRSSLCSSVLSFWRRPGWPEARKKAAFSVETTAAKYGHGHGTGEAWWGWADESFVSSSPPYAQQTWSVQISLSHRRTDCFGNGVESNRAETVGPRRRCGTSIYLLVFCKCVGRWIWTKPSDRVMTSNSREE